MASNFEDDLKKLEELSNEIKKSDVSLEVALKDFEEGIKLAKKMEKQLDSIEAKIQILMKEPAEESPKEENSSSQNFPELELFDGKTEVNGTRNV